MGSSAIPTVVPRIERGSGPLDAITDDELRKGVEQLFARAQRLVDEDGFTVVVLTARRLACVYQLLRSTGTRALTGCRVVSDHFLEAQPDLSAMEDKVVVLDDSIVVGTTVATLHASLVEHLGDPRRIRTLAVCVDKNQRAEYLLESVGAEALFERGSRAVRRFSEQLVQALFQHQVPFFADFPVARPLDVQPRELSALLQTEGWQTADVTAPLLTKRFEQRSVSFIPTKRLFEDVLSRLPEEAASVVEGFKVRTYVTLVGGSSCRLVAVPIAFVSPSTPAQLDSAIASFAGGTRGQVVRACGRIASWSPAARHRVVQYVVSCCVLAELWPALMAAAGDAGEFGLSALTPEPLSLEFGEHAGLVADLTESALTYFAESKGQRSEDMTTLTPVEPPHSALLHDPKLQRLLWETGLLIDQAGIPSSPGPGELTALGAIFGHAVSSIFGFINREYERPERKVVRRLAGWAEYEALFRNSDGRLTEKDLTMREISVALTPELVGGEPWGRMLVSLGIDMGNDLGIVVPQTRYSETRRVAYRCYRIGETAHLADRPLWEAVWSGRRFDSFSAAAEKEALPPLSVPVPVSRFVTEGKGGGQDFGDGGQYPRLRDVVADAVPGEVEALFHGRVYAVHDGKIRATIGDAVGNESLAEFRLDQLSDEDAGKVDTGAWLTWAVFVRDRPGRGRQRASVLRVHPVVMLDEGSRVAAARSSAFLDRCP